MKNTSEILTDVTAFDWYALRYRKCLEKYGPDSMVTKGYKDVLERIDREVIEEKTLEVHYTSDHSRPLDTSA
ncbi:MAG: hypothetical protein WBO06_07490 [Gammaproteobacteria bacterium]